MNDQTQLTTEMAQARAHLVRDAADHLRQFGGSAEVALIAVWGTSAYAAQWHNDVWAPVWGKLVQDVWAEAKKETVG